MKQLFAFALCVWLAATAVANPAFVYITGKSVNLRQEPNTNSKVLAKASYGDVYLIDVDEDSEEPVTDGDWIRIEIFDETGPYSLYPYINRNFVKILNYDGITPDVLEEGFEFDDGTNFGFLTFEKPEKNMVKYTLIVKNREMQESGGNGIIDNQYGEVLYNGNTLNNPEPWIDTVGTAIYDSKTGRLWFAGYLWE